ncbi:hypothetical protein L1987_57065 [Smallanthus sonchifolius]|uniref:Uncharacterized protein n=1 Tax=Smallanthus sonchifolius TaxID=185202 RepID=A0ACB9DBI0_9ASTR|nr:hypothetical protein L1987_57065 [Smallanthus sonchifolius]
MYVYGTIWDGSNWATHNGKYRVDIQRGPFVTGYSFIINGCRVDQFGSTPSECNVTIPSGILSSAERQQMNWYRIWCMTYSCCNDVDRYPNSLPECGVEGPGMQPAEQRILSSLLVLPPSMRQIFGAHGEEYGDGGYWFDEHRESET